MKELKIIDLHRSGEQCTICFENSEGKRVMTDISRTNYNQLIVGMTNVGSIFDECFMLPSNVDSIDVDGVKIYSAKS